MDKIEGLINELLHAAQVYYQETNPIMSDSDYDAKIKYLRTLVSEKTEYKNDDRVNKLLEGDVAGGSEPDGNLISHTSPMLSLGKSNSIEDIKSYVDRLSNMGATGFTLQAKLDGYAISAVYHDGKLVQMSTRGDGNVGQDMSYLINNKEVTIVGLPKELNNPSDYELRGELFLRNSQFDKVNKARETSIGGTFKNSRNAVVGITKKAEQGLGYHAELTFSVYTLMVNNVYTNLDNLRKNEPELVVVDKLTEDDWIKQGGKGKLVVSTNIKDIFDKIDEFGSYRPSFDIPTDGVVLKPFDEAYFYETMGHTQHHPLAFTAYKYPAITKNTKIKSFILTIGKTGRLTPKAVIAPINILGTTIQNVTCNNFNWLYKNNIRINSVVAVGRANDVTPKIINLIIPGDEDLLKVPTKCPECGANLVYEDINENTDEKCQHKISGVKFDRTNLPPKLIKCPNPKCPSRLFYFMRSVVGKQALDIDGLSNVFLSSLIDEGYITNVDSLFALNANEISKVKVGITDKGNPRKLGIVRARNLIKNINIARSSTPAYKMLNSLGFLNLGPSTSKILLDKFGSIINVLNADEQELTDVKGFSKIRIENFTSHQIDAKILYNKLLARGVVMNKPSVKKRSGQSFSISGIVPDGFKNRNEFVNHMESLGWKYDTTPNKNTSIMFGDKYSTSSKIKKAKQFGIKIIESIDEL